MKVLVVGGAGYIGSHVLLALIVAGHTPVVLDDFSTGNSSAVPPGVLVFHSDYADCSLLRYIFTQHTIDGVIHLAGRVQVGESAEKPELYYTENVAKTLVLLDAMVQYGVSKLVFSSSAAVYRGGSAFPLPEGADKIPASPYGMSKLAVEALLHLYRSKGLSSTSLRYFNAAGADWECRTGENRAVETHLVPLAIRTAKAGTSLKVFGNDWPTSDGTCIRDYVHVCDLARAHVLALERGCPVPALNLGTGTGTSVLELIAAVSQHVAPVTYEVTERRPGDVAYLVADPGQAYTVLGWRPEHRSIDAMVLSAAQWDATL